MGDLLRDYYKQRAQSFSAKKRHEAAASYASKVWGPGGETLYSYEFYKKKGYRPSTSQQRLNLDG